MSNSPFNFGQAPAAPAPAFQPPAQTPQAPAFGGFAPPVQQAPAPQATAPMAAGGSPFAGFAGAQAFAQGNYFDVNTDKGPTTALVRIRDMQLKQTFNNGAAVIVEMEVIQSNNPGVPPGTVKGSVYPLNKPVTTRPNLISLLGALLGFSKSKPAELQIINTQVSAQSEQLLDAGCTDGKKYFNGCLLTVTSREHTTRKLEKRTVIDFSPAPNAVPGQGIRG